MRHFCSAFLIILLSMITIRETRAQDIHFSQFYLSPLNYNPAFCGVFDGDYRAGAIYRSQWNTVPVPYSTFSFFGDMSTPFKAIQGDKIGLGLLFNNDVSGDSRYATTQVYIPVSINHKANKDSTLFFSIALQPGISNIGFRTNQLTFDEQYDGDANNPALPNGENFPLIKRTYLDLNTGFRIQYNIIQRSSLVFGVSMLHLNRPQVSYFKNAEIELDPRIVSTVSFSYPVHPKIDVIGDLMFNKQGNYKELVYGAKVSFRMNETEKINVNGGFLIRSKDAFIARIGMDYKQWQAGISYDVNTSAFQAATNRRGAIEFGLIYIFSKPKLFTPKKRVCPVYM